MMHFSMRLLEIESNSLFIILVPRRIFTTIPFNNLADDDSVNDLTDVGQCRFQNLAQDKDRFDVLVYLRKRLLAWMEEINDPLLNNWNRDQLLDNRSI